MTEIKKPVKPMPKRLSAPPPEQSKPSKWIAAFWWIVFIVPVVFTYIATNSFIPPAILIGIRIAAMFIPDRIWKKKAVETKKEPDAPTQPIAKVNVPSGILTPYIEEAKAELHGLLKFLRIYNHEKEDKYLKDYRKLRGWE